MLEKRGKEALCVALSSDISARRTRYVLLKKDWRRGL
jgi:hypothetical protein